MQTFATCHKGAVIWLEQLQSLQEFHLGVTKYTDGNENVVLN
jgi:hypothetical protein